MTNVERTGNKAGFDFGCQNGVRVNANGNVQYSFDGGNLSWTTKITDISGNDFDVVTNAQNACRQVQINLLMPTEHSPI